MSAIRPGDLAVVVRTCSCADGLRDLGRIVTVRHISACDDGVHCTACDRHYPEAKRVAVLVNPENPRRDAYWPVPWLKRILPPDQLGLTDEVEDATIANAYPSVKGAVAILHRIRGGK